VFILVPADPCSPGQRAIRWLLLLLSLHFVLFDQSSCLELLQIGRVSQKRNFVKFKLTYVQFDRIGPLVGPGCK